MVFAWEPTSDGCLKPVQRQISDGCHRCMAVSSDDALLTLRSFLSTYSSATHHPSSQETDVHRPSLASLWEAILRPNKAYLDLKAQGDKYPKGGVCEDAKEETDEELTNLVVQQMDEVMGSVAQEECGGLVWEQSGKGWSVNEEAVVNKRDESGAEPAKLVQEMAGMAFEEVESGKSCMVQEAAAVNKWEESGAEPAKLAQEMAGMAFEEEESVKSCLVQEAAAVNNWEESGAEPAKLAQEMAGMAFEEVESGKSCMVQEAAAVNKWEESGAEPAKLAQEMAGMAFEEVESVKSCLVQEAAAVNKWEESGAKPAKLAQEMAGMAFEEVESVKSCLVQEAAAVNKWEESGAKPAKLAQEMAGMAFEEVESVKSCIVQEAAVVNKCDEEGAEPAKLAQETAGMAFEEVGSVKSCLVQEAAAVNKWEESGAEPVKLAQETAGMAFEEVESGKSCIVQESHKVIEYTGQKESRGLGTAVKEIQSEDGNEDCAEGAERKNEQLHLQRDPKGAEDNPGPSKRKSSSVKMAADRGGGDDNRKAGHAKQADGGKSQTSCRGRSDGRHSCRAAACNAWSGNGDGDDDDDDGSHKRRPSDPTKRKPGCDMWSGRKRKPDKKSSSLSPTPVSPEDWEARGARPKARPRPGSGGDQGSEGHAKVRPEPESEPELKLQQQLQRMSLGPAREARNGRCVASHLSEAHSPAGRRMPRTRRNQLAVVKMYRDPGVWSHRHLAGSVPSGLRWGRSHAEQGDPATAVSFEVGPTSTGARPQAADDDPGASDVVSLLLSDLSAVEIPPGVSHGEPRLLMAFANQVGRRRSCDARQLHGQHEGVLRDKELMVVDGQFREGEQSTKVKCLGKGSFGNVYLIQDVNTKKKVVAKQVLVAAFAPMEVLTCTLAHPGIVSVEGLLRTDDTMTMIFPYHPDCQTLQCLINQSVLGQGRAMRLTVQLLLALQYLHSQGIVHRDVKPGNLLILTGDRLKVIDFGEAVLLTASQHSEPEGKPKGTECFMSPEIAGGEGHDGRTDVWSTGCTLVSMIAGYPPWCQRFKGVLCKIYIIASREPPLEDIPSNTHPRLRSFIGQTLKKDLQERPTAAEALTILPLDIADELYDTLAIEPAEPELEPTDKDIGDLPRDAFPGPQTPWTPRAPQGSFCPFLERKTPPRPNRPAQELLVSCLLIPSDVEPGTREASEMDVDEDMYGPSVEPDSPETFNEGAFQPRPSEVHSCAPSIGPRDVSRTPSLNAANFDLPLKNHLGGARLSSQATSSFMQDNAGNPLGLSGESLSFEIGPMSLSGSIEECHSVNTAHALLMRDGQMPSVEGAAGYQPDSSGVVTNSRGHSAGDLKASQTETVPSTSSTASGGIVAVVAMEDVEPIRMRLEPDFTVRALAGSIVGLQKYKDSQLASKAMTVRWRDTGEILPLNHTFGCGEHQLVAVEVLEGTSWYIDSRGEITKAA